MLQVPVQVVLRVCSDAVASCLTDRLWNRKNRHLHPVSEGFRKSTDHRQSIG